MHKKSDQKLLNHLVYVFFRFSLEKFSLHFDFWEPTINSSYLITWDFLAIQTESNPITHDVMPCSSIDLLSFLNKLIKRSLLQLVI